MPETREEETFSESLREPPSIVLSTLCVFTFTSVMAQTMFSIIRTVTQGEAPCTGEATLGAQSHPRERCGSRAGGYSEGGGGSEGGGPSQHSASASAAASLCCRLPLLERDGEFHPILHSLTLLLRRKHRLREPLHIAQRARESTYLAIECSKSGLGWDGDGVDGARWGSGGAKRVWGVG